MVHTILLFMAKIIKPNSHSLSRRSFIAKSIIGCASLYSSPGLFAELLAKTPSQVEGPFYPNILPLDTDNDLIILNDHITPAIGNVTHLSGKITDMKGTPLLNALIEIWQVDSTGSYIHTGSARYDKRDKNFQGYGKFLTGAKGEYYFRTIKPVTYPGRTPHIHVRVSVKGKTIVTTQLYVAGETRNDSDFLLKRAGEHKDALISKFTPLVGSKTGELAAEFNIILGITPEDKH